jgi:pyruvate/2-oxoglutarate dehydrogenase complex dihydrolipoamide dehydrogenase (E3) component
LREWCKADNAIIVGAGNSAGQAAIHVAEEAKKVTILVRKGTLAAKTSAYLVNQIKADPKIEVLENAEVASVDPDASGKVSGVTLKDGRKLPAKGVGVFIGSSPEAGWAGVERMSEGRERGYIKVGGEGRDPLETSIPGVYAAGDVRAGSVHRVITAAADGATAISMIHGYLPKVSKRDLDKSLGLDRQPGTPVALQAQQALAEAGADGEEAELANAAGVYPDDTADRWMNTMDAYDHTQPFTGGGEDQDG